MLIWGEKEKAFSRPHVRSEMRKCIILCANLCNGPDDTDDTGYTRSVANFSKHNSTRYAGGMASPYLQSTGTENDTNADLTSQ